MSNKIILPPNPARLIEGLRDTGYNFNTALADIVDNSIDAKATLIDINIQMDTDGEIEISVADNGHGMDEATLFDGMTYGAKGLADPKRLGKFGLGLKTASTAFCRKLSVITRKDQNAELIKATWDLDHVVKMGEWELLLEEPESYEVDLFNKVSSRSSGTLVIWHKVDRLIKTYSNNGKAFARKALDKAITGFRDHASMVYQRFLDQNDTRARNLEMILNGTPIKPWDPFCLNESETELVAETIMPAETSDGLESKFHIRAYILPRRESFSSSEAEKEARLTNGMQGFYIYRENRLIHYADWLGMFSKEPHISLLRVEFSFDHTLDDAFKVDIKKSQLILNDVLYDWILTKFLPAPRNAANDRYRTGQRKMVTGKAKGAHDGSNRSISNKESDLKRAEVKVIDKDSNEVEINNKLGTVRVKLKITDSTAPGQFFVQPVDGLNDNILWEPALIDGHHAVRINTGHPYYSKVYVPNLSSDVTIQGIDSLLWAFIEAELGTINESTKTHFEELRFEVSRLLRKLVEDFPDPQLGNEE